MMNINESIQRVSDAMLCSNCGACNAICPRQAITFKMTALGRMYAQVNDKCINCGLCSQVCPSLDKKSLHNIYEDKYVGLIRQVYVGKSTNSLYFENAQSGGACTAIIDYLLEKKKIDCAVLCRMTAGNPPLIETVVIEDKRDLYKCQKSCYTPVDILSVLKAIGKEKKIAVVGLPCHIQGCENLIRTSAKFANIRYKIGLVCDRTLCAGIQRVMLSYYPTDSAKINWRKKDCHIDGVYYPYKSAPVTLQFAHKKECVLPNYYRMTLKDYFTAPRCRVCYDKLNIFADIVLGDPWGMSGVDWNKGASVIILRSEKGEELIKRMQEECKLEMSERNVKELLHGQHIEERRHSVAVYSRALEQIPTKIDSYLYLQGGVKISSKDLKESNKQIAGFIKRDKYDIESIIKEARAIIRKRNKQELTNKLLVVRILRRIKKKLNQLIH